MTRQDGVWLMWLVGGSVYAVDWAVRLCRAVREAHKEIVKAEQAYAADLKRQAAGLPSIVPVGHVHVSYNVEEPALDGDRWLPSGP